METAGLHLHVCVCSPRLFESKTQRFRKRNSAAKSVVAVTFAKRSSSESYEWGHDHCGGGRWVEESMVVLRKRIHQMKVMERNYEPPADWSEWEKQYHACYDEYVCKFVGFLQLHLMNTRPSLALAVILLVAMSVPTSTVLVLLRLLELANGALSSVHLN